jgi:hypothetical protein
MLLLRTFGIFANAPFRWVCYIELARYYPLGGNRCSSVDFDYFPAEIADS